MLTGSPLCQLTVRFHLIKESPSPLKAFELFSPPLEFRKATRTAFPPPAIPMVVEKPSSRAVSCFLSPASCWRPACPRWTRVFILHCCSHTSGPRQQTFAGEEDMRAAPASGANVVGAHCWVCLTLAQGCVWRLDFAQELDLWVALPAALSHLPSLHFSTCTLAAQILVSERPRQTVGGQGQPTANKMFARTA